MSILFILGAPDPEMAAIERHVRAAGYPVVYATVQFSGLQHISEGGRVRPDSAYRAARIDIGGRDDIDLAVLVECEPIDVVDGDGNSIHQMMVDHHRPGDVGYGRPPAEYLEASSLGQVLALLGIEPNDEDRLIAAADHCLAAAYRGECPGVDPDRLMAWRAESRAAFQGRPVEQVLADVDRARSELRAAPRREIAGVPVAVFEATIAELPEAAAREGIPFLANLVERGQRKTVLQAAPAEVVAAWMDEQRNAGLLPYGDPARGFAGVVHKAESQSLA